MGPSSGGEPAGAEGAWVPRGSRIQRSFPECLGEGAPPSPDKLPCISRKQLPGRRQRVPPDSPGEQILLLLCQSQGTQSLPSTPAYEGRETSYLSEAWGSLHDEEEAFAKKDAGFGAGWVQTWGLPWEAGAQVQAPGWAQAGCVLRATHRRLRCSRGAAPPLCSPCPGLGCPPYLPARVGWAKLRCGRLPTGLGPDPWPWRGRVGVCGGTGRGERPADRAGRGWHAPCWAGAESSAPATPGVKRSGPRWCNPPVGKPTSLEASGPPSQSREGQGTPPGWGRARTSGASCPW